MAILWGRDARTLKPLLTPHPCIESAHPSPLSAHNGFFGSKPFSRANAHARRAGRRADRLAPALTQEEVGGAQRGSSGRLTALVGALVFLDLVLWFAVAPLLPGWEESLGLSKAQSGIVVGAYSAAVLLASVPAGNLADRFGPRRVTIAATLLFGIAAPLHAFVGSFAELVGLRFAAGRLQRRLLVGGPGLGDRERAARAPREHGGGDQHGTPDRRRSSGRSSAGRVVQLVGIKAAMGGLGVLVLLLGLVAAREPEVHGPKHEHVPLRESLRTVALDSWLLSANVALIVLAIAGTTMQTLGSLHLSDLGLSGTGVGAAFTAVAIAAALYDVLALARGRPARPAQARRARDTAARAHARGHGAAARDGRVHRRHDRVRDRPGDRLHRLLSAGRRRRRARGRRAGHRHGTARGAAGAWAR